MLRSVNTIRTALQIYGAMNRHEYDVVDELREQHAGRLHFHRAVTAVQPTAGLAAPLVLARSAREREKTAMAKSKEMPRWTVRNALRVFGDRYREAVGVAKNVVEKVTQNASERNHQTLRKALRFYGTQWRTANLGLAVA